MIQKNFLMLIKWDFPKPRNIGIPFGMDPKADASGRFLLTKVDFSID